MQAAELSKSVEEIAVVHSKNAALEIVFKVQETCNINCSYCYMYNLGNDAFKLMPQQYASRETWLGVASFILKELGRRSPPFVRLVIHGGEPMLVKARVMEGHLQAFWDELRNNLPPEDLAKIQMTIQSNGMLVTKDWIDILKRWNIRLGVSLDGPVTAHDQYRVDKLGRGTHARVIAGINEIQDASVPFGILCVMNSEASGAEVYRYFVDDIGVKGFSFLFPFMNWENYDQKVVDGVSSFLTSAFHEWQKDIASGEFVNVRVFNEVIAALMKRTLPPQDRKVEVGHHVIVVECDGTIMTEESLRPTYSGTFSDFNISSVSLEEILNAEDFQQVDRDQFSLAKECEGCALLPTCRSGQTLGRVGMRYDSKSPAIRKSVYCAAFIDLFVEAAAFLQTNKMAMPSLPNTVNEFNG